MGRFPCLRVLVAIFALCGGFQSATANPVLDGADPDVLVARGQYWIYPTTEDDAKTKFFAYHSNDLQHWIKTPELFAFKNVSWLNADKAPSHELWAPGVYAEGDKVFLYFAVGPQHPTPSRIGVAVSDSPAGPFIDSGAPLITGDDKFEAIDPMVFKDVKTGKVYLYCGGSAGPEMRVYQLSNDNTRVVKRVDVATPENFTEGPFMHERDGKYYLSYSHGKWNDDSYSVAYSTADSPLGPWIYHGPILQTDARHAGPGHHAIFKNPVSGDWFIAYHRWNNAKRDRKMPSGRSVAIESLHYDEHGFIKPIVMTDDAPPASLLQN